MNKGIINIFRLVFLTLAAGFFFSCSKPIASEDQCIAFYSKTKPHAKGIVEDTEDLISKAPDIYVTEDGTSKSFDEEPVKHTANAVWRSDKKWENRAYTFFAYVKSEGKKEYPYGSSISVPHESDGRTVTITQPKIYSESPDDYVDYLLSYRVSADGSKRPLVNIELERVTTGVELYVTAAPNMTDVRLLKAEFVNIYRSATYNIAYHATTTDPVVDGLKNKWAVRMSQVTTDRTTYTYAPARGLSLQKYNEEAGRFAPENRVMRFLTVQQNLMVDDLAVLNLTYSSQENGVTREYTQSFNLYDYSVKTWKVGHKIRYYVSLDTSVKLEGTIEPWRNVDYIEGTFLPN